MLYPSKRDPIFSNRSFEHYLGRRSALQDAVSATLSPRKNVHLSGSFTRDEFHLDPRLTRSFSDVDVIISDYYSTDIELLRTEIGQALSAASGTKLSVGCAPPHQFQGLNPADARFLALGEYLRRVPTLQSNQHCAYLRAKTALMTLRIHQGENYRSVVNRIGSMGAHEAIAVKLGLRQEFPPYSLAELLRGEGATEESLTFVGMLENSSSYQKSCEYFLGELQHRTTIPSWLLDTMVRFLRS